MIVKNEEQFLDQCLAALDGVAHQIVVVDTGSTDRTVQIAKAHGAEVHHFDWCDDFAAARNFALEHARGDWVLVLDADEVLTTEGLNGLRQDMATPNLMGCRIRAYISSRAPMAATSPWPMRGITFPALCVTRRACILWASFTNKFSPPPRCGRRIGR